MFQFLFPEVRSRVWHPMFMDKMVSVESKSYMSVEMIADQVGFAALHGSDPTAGSSRDNVRETPQAKSKTGALSGAADLK